MIQTAIRCMLAGFLLLHLQSQGQPEFRKFKVTHWDSRTGMPNDISLNIFQSTDGFIWLSGYSGLIRFDGASFTIFNSTTDSIFKSDGITSIIIQTPDSVLWIPTPGSGLIRYKNGRFKPFIRDRTNLSALGQNHQNELLIGLGPLAKEIILFNFKTHEYRALTASQSDSVINLWREQDKVNWYSPFSALRTRKAGEVRVEGRKIELPNDSSLLNLNSALQDSKGRIWVGSQLGIVQLLTGKKIPAPGLENETIIPSGFNRSMIIEDNDRGIWIGTRNGIAYMPEHADRFTFYNGGSVKLNNVQAILKDNEGNVWVAADKGLFKFSPSKVANYTERDGLVNSRLSSINETAPGNFILSTRDNRLYSFRGDSMRPVAASIQDFVDIKREIFYLYTDRQKNLWVACNGALFMVGKDRRKKWITNHQVRYVTEGLDGKIYFAATGRGFGYIDGQDSIRYLSFPGIDFSTNFVSTIKQRNNGEWVLTSYGDGIMIGRLGNKPRTYRKINGVGGIQVFSSYEDRDNHLWFPTAKGLAFIRNGSDSLEVLDNTDGMPIISTFEVLEDGSGFFWLPTNLGVIKVSRAELLAHLADSTKTINWTVLDEGDGMVNQQFVGARHPIKASDGKFYFPNISGLVVIDPGEITRNEVKPKLAINGMMVDDRFYGTDTAIVVQPGDHRYLISYSAMSFLAPEKVQIKFRLVGYDRDWILSQGDRRAIYTNLPPGDHVFEMIAANDDGVWADAPVQLRFTVKPYFYQTTWFLVLCGLALAGLIWLIVRWRTAATRKYNQELEALVSKRTEQLSRQKTEIEETLNKLKATQTQLIQSEKMASLGELTAGIAHEIQNPLNFVNNFAELNAELADELAEAADKGDLDNVKALALDIRSNQEKIAEHGKRADGIVKGMLQHSRANSGQKEPTDINTLADEYLRLAYHGIRAKDKSFNTKVETDFDPALPRIEVVPQEIGRVMLNLFNNAFYAVSERGKQAGTDYQPQITLQTRLISEGVTTGGEGKPVVRITVTDNGIGIPDSIKEKIFQPFFTTKPTGQGTGLGLSLSYDIVKAHGGKITLNSQQGKGSSFQVQLPAQE